VTLFLHPTLFTPHVICLTRPPFEISRVGWAIFDVDVLVHFAPHLGLGSREYSHRLSFFGDGECSSFSIQIDKRKLIPHKA
jgi:transcription initiation factor IIF auxiliary subunit